MKEKKYSIKMVKFILFTVFILSVLTACNKDNSTNPIEKKDDVFIYGLIGVAPQYDNPDASRYWVYSRVFNHPNYQTLQAELSKDNNVIPLETDHSYSNKYFTEGRLDMSFNPYDKYKLRIWNSENSYTGTITTLPKLEIVKKILTSNQISLEWSDIKADFYNINIYQYGFFDKNYQTKDTAIVINLNELPRSYNKKIYISIDGMKGFDFTQKTGGNIRGCYGYLFGFSSAERIELNGSNMSLSTPSISENKSNSEKIILSLYKNNFFQNKNTSSKIKFNFTYASFYNSSYRQSGYNSFKSVTLISPIDSLKTFEGYIDNMKLESSNWAGFYNILRSNGNVYETYNANLGSRFILNINNKIDTAFVAHPDTFSIVSKFPSSIIPASPFKIKWNIPDNADFFFVDVSWQVYGDSLDKNYFYTTNNNYYNISEIPDSSVSGIISVIAVNGASPMKSLVPNLKKSNGYLYSYRRSHNNIHFANSHLGKQIDAKIKSRNYNARFDNFMISKLSEKYSELKTYHNDLAKWIK